MLVRDGVNMSKNIPILHNTLLRRTKNGVVASMRLVRLDMLSNVWITFVNDCNLLWGPSLELPCPVINDAEGEDDE